LLQSGNYGATHVPDPGEVHALHNPENAANENRKTKECTGSGKEEYPAPGFVETGAANVQELPEIAANKHPLRSIRAKDYKKLDIPEPANRCFVCRKKGAWFVEKFTRERRAREKGQRDARRLCRACYAAAVKAEQDASVSPAGDI